MISTYNDRFRAAVESACFDAKGYIYGEAQAVELLNTAAAISSLEGLSEEHFVLEARKAYAKLTRARAASAVRIIEPALVSEKKA